MCIRLDDGYHRWFTNRTKVIECNTNKLEVTPKTEGL